MVLRIVLLLPQSRQADLENPLKWTKNPPNALNLFIPEKSSFIFKSIAFFLEVYLLLSKLNIGLKFAIDFLTCTTDTLHMYFKRMILTKINENG